MRYSRFSPSTSRCSRFTTVPAPWWGYTTLSPTLYKLTPSPVSSQKRRRPQGLPAKTAEYTRNSRKSAIFAGVFGADVFEKIPAQTGFSTSAAASASRASPPRRSRPPSRPARAPTSSPSLRHSSTAAGACVAGRSRPVRPISPNAASPSRTGDAARGRGDRERDPEVGAGLVDPDAAGDVDEHVGAAERQRRRAGRARRRSSRGASGRRRWRRGAASRGRSARRAPGSRAAAAASPRARRPRRRRPRPARCGRRAPRGRGRRRGRSPVISKTPSSFVEPKRFLTARRMRWAW